ncbi:phosphoenolpyruvate hydrolase family protein [Enterococcus saccharolyticus]|uniref:phosphoenolpyruvate hydrolase family protein n=1 Tax=Enterococcus saccharolyticus TaxID=41997 RepID=UPI0013EFC21D|nr:phosphoenolpyruvate hydrolase family protein [Enterococcus saccharolyticus]
MAEAGADILVAHMGLTTKGTIGAKTALTLDDCVEKIEAIIDAGRKVNPEIMVICHGGPIAEPEDAKYIIEKTKGMMVSLVLPVLSALQLKKGIREQTAAFKRLRINRVCFLYQNR